MVVHSHAYSTFRDDGVFPTAFSYNDELGHPVPVPDGAALSIYSPEPESQEISLFASGDMDREDQDYTKSGRTQEQSRDGNDECIPTSRRDGGKMRVRQLSCPARPKQNNQAPVTGQRTETGPRRTPQRGEIPETEPYIPLQFLNQDEETCLPALIGKGNNFFSAPNIPVCSTGLDQMNFPLVRMAKFVTLQECFPCKSSFPNKLQKSCLFMVAKSCDKISNVV